MSIFHAPFFLDADDAPHEAGARASGYGLRYGRSARARRETALPHFGVRIDLDARPPAGRSATCASCAAPA